MTTRQVFISYSLSDADWVSHVRDQIVGAGLPAYLAVHDMQPGRDVLDKIQKAIDANAAVMVVLTKNATAPTWVQQEIGYASRGGKLVVPLVSPLRRCNTRGSGDTQLCGVRAIRPRRPRAWFTGLYDSWSPPDGRTRKKCSGSQGGPIVIYADGNRQVT
ncbi:MULTISPECIES: toll/interleukin-1 receptor domain-containing protein [Ferrimicrobium]|uniref:Toll/interleukin-1 receptor domain-containing protein n=1 Tax=Ferrimicrobium acidiphilum TaxID=121039 RepID=A0ABV3Y4B1_9ACTN|nr:MULTISPECIES: toll/interleukin-1 receptor domain-containing protein [Ferrimicrobium]